MFNLKKDARCTENYNDTDKDLVTQKAINTSETKWLSWLLIWRSQKKTVFVTFKVNFFLLVNSFEFWAGFFLFLFFVVVFFTQSVVYVLKLMKLAALTKEKGEALNLMVCVSLSLSLSVCLTVCWICWCSFVYRFCHVYLPSDVRSITKCWYQ